jgi:tetratricopeptide (TPR) repeat protein
MSSLTSATYLPQHILEDALLVGRATNKSREELVKLCDYSKSHIEQTQVIDIPELASIALAIYDGNFAHVLQLPCFTEIFDPLFNLSVPSASITSAISSNIESFVHSSESSVTAKFQVLLIGVAALLGYAQSNWTGPRLARSPLIKPTDTEDNVSQYETFWEQASRSLLRSDGEDLYERISHRHLLFIATTILNSSSSDSLLGEIRSYSWWSLRSARLHQLSLETNSSTIKAWIDRTLAKTLSLYNEPSNSRSLFQQYLQAQLNIEAAQVQLTFWQYGSAGSHLQAASNALSLQVVVTGILGMRTRFQTQKKSQLVVTVQSPSGKPEGSCNRLPFDADNENLAKMMPKQSDVSDEVLLDELKLDTPVDLPRLHAIERALLLAYVEFMSRSAPIADVTAQQQLLAFLRAILAADHHRSYIVEAYALFQRSLLELNDTHRFDRGMLQLEELSLHSFSRTDNEVLDTLQASVRLDNLFLTAYPSLWSLEKQIGGRFESLGFMKSALECYERIEWWDGIVRMEISLGRKTHAEELLLKQLESTNRAQKPKWLCLLGDVRDSAELYMEAWEVSQQSYPRAQRSLGKYYRVRNDYKEAITHYQLALGLNPGFPQEWFALGYCAMEIKDYVTATSAFSRSVTFDPEYADAWNNLAASHLHAKNMRSAFLALEQAVRLKNESWKLWENYLYCALDIGEYAKALTAVENIANLKGRESNYELKGRGHGQKIVPVDERVLKSLDGIVRNDIVKNGKNSILSDRWRALLYKLSERVADNVVLWTCCVSLSVARGEFVDAVAFGEKALRFSQEGTEWLSRPELFQLIVSSAETLLDAIHAAIRANQSKLSALNSARLLISSIIERVRKSGSNEIQQSAEFESLLQLYSKLATESSEDTEPSNVASTNSRSRDELFGGSGSYLDQFR